MTKYSKPVLHFNTWGIYNTFKGVKYTGNTNTTSTRENFTILRNRTMITSMQKRIFRNGWKEVTDEHWKEIIIRQHLHDQWSQRRDGTQMAHSWLYLIEEMKYIVRIFHVYGEAKTKHCKTKQAHIDWKRILINKANKINTFDLERILA